jgi:hypothetical protein
MMNQIKTPESALLARYIEEGFSLVRLRAGEKRPYEENWPDGPSLSIDDALNHINGGGGIGVRLGSRSKNLYCIDVDDFGIENFLALNPRITQRVQWRKGQDGRGSILVRGAGWSEIESGGTNDLQILGDRKQCVLPPSLHPEAQRPYTWEGRQELPLVLNAEPSEFSFPFALVQATHTQTEDNFSPAEKETLRKLQEIVGQAMDHVDGKEAFFNCPSHVPDLTASFSYNLANHRFNCFHAQPLKGQGLENLRKAVKPASAAPKSVVAPNGASITSSHSTGVKLSQVYSALTDIISSPWTPDILDLSLATLVNAPRTKQHLDLPLWLCIVGAPSSGKTEVAMGLRACDGIYYVDELSENSFISGYVDNKGKSKNVDLLPLVDSKCFAVKDLSSLFSKKAEVVANVIGQMTPIYDGSYAKVTGTRGRISYDSTFSFLSCVTPAALKKHQHYMNEMGARVLFYHLPQETAQEQTRGMQMQADLQRAAKIKNFNNLCSAFAQGLLARATAPVCVTNQISDYHQPSITYTPAQDLQVLARLVARGRTIGEWIDQHYHITQQEEPYRAYGQFLALARSLAVVHGSWEVTDHELELARRVAFSSLPIRRASALKMFSSASGNQISVKQCAALLKQSDDSARRLLKELEEIQILESVQTAQGQCWKPRSEFARVLSSPVNPIGSLHQIDVEVMERVNEELARLGSVAA